jgi:TldD protein
MFGVQEARHITNGTLRETLRGITISGNVFQALQTVDAVGRDFEVEAGTCGKEQPVWVGIGGPHLRMKALIGGAST